MSLPALSSRARTKRDDSCSDLGEVSEKIPRERHKVKTSGLKGFANTHLPEGSKLRYLLLGEKDEIDADAFLVKMDLWLRLLRMEFS